jgi:hypothetical protein
MSGDSITVFYATVSDDCPCNFFRLVSIIEQMMHVLWELFSLWALL